MEMVVATFGGILLLLSFVMKSMCFQNNRNSLKGERISAAVIGIGLIASAVVLDIGAPLISLLTTFGITVLAVDVRLHNALERSLEDKLTDLY